MATTSCRTCAPRQQGIPHKHTQTHCTHRSLVHCSAGCKESVQNLRMPILTRHEQRRCSIQLQKHGGGGGGDPQELPPEHHIQKTVPVALDATRLPWLEQYLRLQSAEPAPPLRGHSHLQLALASLRPPDVRKEPTHTALETSRIARVASRTHARKQAQQNSRCATLALFTAAPAAKRARTAFT